MAFFEFYDFLILCIMSRPSVHGFIYYKDVTDRIDILGWQSASLSCARKKSFVISSDGKIEVVTPTSAPILVMVARCGTDKFFTPGPKYSRTLPTFPFVVRIDSTLRITSIDETQGGSLPSRLTPITLGQIILNGLLD